MSPKGEESPMSRRLNGATLFAMGLRANLLQAAWNFERQQGLGWAHALAPALRHKSSAISSSRRLIWRMVLASGEPTNRKRPWLRRSPVVTPPGECFPRRKSRSICRDIEAAMRTKVAALRGSFRARLKRIRGAGQA